MIQIMIQHIKISPLLKAWLFRYHLEKADNLLTKVSFLNNINADIEKLKLTKKYREGLDRMITSRYKHRSASE